mmetsp:Transcript_47031/g.54215  ORF Transcript_47031/g.54215 Transcript_47031/m.54215 type:complete len:256 (+) Transcript_47031:40-807(+)
MAFWEHFRLRPKTLNEWAERPETELYLRYHNARTALAQAGKNTLLDRILGGEVYCPPHSRTPFRVLTWKQTFLNRGYGFGQNDYADWDNRERGIWLGTVVMARHLIAKSKADPDFDKQLRADADKVNWHVNLEWVYTAGAAAVGAYVSKFYCHPSSFYAKKMVFSAIVGFGYMWLARAQSWQAVNVAFYKYYPELPEEYQTYFKNTDHRYLTLSDHVQTDEEGKPNNLTTEFNEVYDLLNGEYSYLKNFIRYSNY